MALGSPREFSQWSDSYDADVRGIAGFPFGGYESALARVVELAAAGPSTSVLDLGIGTGNLAMHFVAMGCSVWGMDFSDGMLALARAKLPDVPLARADILGSWPEEFRQRYDRIVSAYVFHHFELKEKLDLLVRLGRDHCARSGGILIADVAFPTGAALDQARERWADSWDEEHYWVADRDVPACERVGLDVSYERIGEFTGVFSVRQSPTRRRAG